MCLCSAYVRLISFVCDSKLPTDFPPNVSLCSNEINVYFMLTHVMRIQYYYCYLCVLCMHACLRSHQSMCIYCFGNCVVVGGVVVFLLCHTILHTFGVRLCWMFLFLFGWYVVCCCALVSFLCAENVFVRMVRDFFHLWEWNMHQNKTNYEDQPRGWCSIVSYLQFEMCISICVPFIVWFFIYFRRIVRMATNTTVRRIYHFDGFINLLMALSNLMRSTY